MKSAPAMTILVRNLNMLLDLKKWSNRELSRHCKVSDRMIGMIRKGDVKACTMDVADELASAFGLETWELIMPHLKEDLIRSAIKDLVKSYADADPDGRAYIERVAEKESTYKAGNQ